MKYIDKDFLVAAFKRALHTFFQTLTGYLVVGYTLEQIDWKTAFSVAAVAALASIAKSFAVGTPEAESEGTLLIDTSDEEKDLYLLQFNGDLEDISKKRSVTFKVDPNASLDD